MGTELPEIVTGNDLVLPVTLRRDGATFTIDPGATVRAAIINHTHSMALTGASVQSNATAGTDWANSLVVCVIPASDTVGITTQGRAKLEIQVNDVYVKTWFVEILIIRGTII